MTPEQKAYCERELEEIAGSGSIHSAYVIAQIGGMGSMHLCDVSPAVVGFGQEDDPYYQQYLHNWDEVNALITDIKKAAEEAWGKDK